MRTYVITGAASGVGKATAQMVEAAGDRVISVDLRDADVIADLSTKEGRDHMVAEVGRLTDGKIDAIVANAGLAINASVAMAVNYFGAIATLEGLRPYLAGSEAPRAVITASMASLQPYNEELLEACLNGTEEEAMAISEANSDPAGYVNYPTSKRAIVRWMRANAIKEEWAGAGIPLNAIAPAIILTPMTEPLFADPVKREHMLKSVPMPLNGPAPAEACASAIMFLASPGNTHACGQVLFTDGGYEATTRGAGQW
ncbi:SDR family oxidoreductase [Timonella senegalensis]|uniref:SDR family oxidoreductase n=1 Tax=Timonella senegalensis TaxID=1465825 RepID=UPI0028B16631|nr:SDR family oxidoreductase [Timonella senegalensis]